MRIQTLACTKLDLRIQSLEHDGKICNSITAKAERHGNESDFDPQPSSQTSVYYHRQLQLLGGC